MRVPTTLQIVSLMVFISLSVSCAGHKQTAGLQLGLQQDELIGQARAAAESSMKETDHGRAKEEAVLGTTLAERCILSTPDEAGCYYWFAVNTGLYYKIRKLGYQRGVKIMIKNLEKVISLDASYDNAGAYRILGQIYTQLPQTGGAADSVTRDLPLAEKYLRRAVEVAPDYPENYLSLAETLLEEEKPEEALQCLTKARKSAPDWKSDISFNDWQKTMAGLEKKLIKTK